MNSAHEKPATFTGRGLWCHEKWRDRDRVLLLLFLGRLLGGFLLCHSDNLLSACLASIEISGICGADRHVNIKHRGATLSPAREVRMHALCGEEFICQ